MKRAFLYGLTTFFALLMLSGINEMVNGSFYLGAMMLIFFASVSAATGKAARNAPAGDIPKRKKVAAWFAGFLAPDAAMLAFVGLIAILQAR